jgi:hypothetical protein
MAEPDVALPAAGGMLDLEKFLPWTSSHIVAEPKGLLVSVLESELCLAIASQPESDARAPGRMLDFEIFALDFESHRSRARRHAGQCARVRSLPCHCLSPRV